MNKGMRMALMSRGRNKDDHRDSTRRYKNMDNYDDEIYDYDRYRYKNGRFAPKPRSEYDRDITFVAVMAESIMTTVVSPRIVF